MALGDGRRGAVLERRWRDARADRRECIEDRRGRSGPSPQPVEQDVADVVDGGIEDVQHDRMAEVQIQERTRRLCVLPSLRVEPLECHCGVAEHLQRLHCPSCREDGRDGQIVRNVGQTVRNRRRSLATAVGRLSRFHTTGVMRDVEQETVFARLVDRHLDDGCRLATVILAGDRLEAEDAVQEGAASDMRLRASPRLS